MYSDHSEYSLLEKRSIITTHQSRKLKDHSQYEDFQCSSSKPFSAQLIRYQEMYCFSVELIRCQETIHSHAEPDSHASAPNQIMKNVAMSVMYTVPWQCQHCVLLFTSKGKRKKHLKAV